MQELGELWILTCGLEKRCQTSRLSKTRINAGLSSVQKTAQS